MGQIDDRNEASTSLSGAWDAVDRLPHLDFFYIDRTIAQLLVDALDKFVLIWISVNEMTVLDSHKLS